ncbi:MAG TPA: N-acetyltransferase [Caulobacteraceae bacterium]|jgi:predicted N-acetyltransferase YhbS
MAAAQISEPDPVVIDLETEADAKAVAYLVDHAFGPGRWAKTAERLREHNRPIAGLSFVARERGRVVGSVRLWPVKIGETAAAFLGPIAVEDAQRRNGVGARLVEQACTAAQAQGVAAVLLVGDEPYFGRFGFVRCTACLPGPVDTRRVLIRPCDGREAPVGDVRRP